MDIPHIEKYPLYIINDPKPRRKPNPRKITISVQIDRDFFEEITAKALENSMNLSEFIRDSLKEAIERR